MYYLPFLKLASRLIAPLHLNSTFSQILLVRPDESPSWFDTLRKSWRSMSNGALAVPTHPHHPQGTMGNLVRGRADKTRRRAAGNYNLPILVLRDVQRLQFAGKTKKQLTNNLIAFEEVLRIKIQPPSWYVNVCVNANDMQIVSVVVSTVTCPDAGKLYTLLSANASQPCQGKSHANNNNNASRSQQLHIIPR